MRLPHSVRAALPSLLWALGGCAPVPSTSRASSTMASAPGAPSTPRVPVGRALTRDPPLPGESLAGWPGLVDTSDRSTPPDESSARTLDVEAAVRIALERDRELRARLADLGVTRGLAVQAGRLPNPELELELLPERESRLEIALAYDLTSAILAPMRARVVRSELESERVALAGYVVSVGFEARRAFHALVAAEERLAIVERSLDTLAAGRDASAALYAAGNITALDYAARVAAYENARIEVTSYEVAVSDARESLVRALGLHGPDAAVVVSHDRSAVPHELEEPADPERSAIEASLELASMRAALDALDRRGRLVRVEGRLPDLSVDLHVLHGRPEASPELAQDPSVRFGGGVTLGFPLADRRQGTRASIEAATDAALARYDGAAIAIRAHARATWNRVVAAHARVRAYEETVRPLGDRVLDETRLQYDAMQVDVHRLLAAHRDRQSIELAYVEARREYFTASAAFDALLAGMRVDVGAASMPSRSSEASESEGGHG